MELYLPVTGSKYNRAIKGILVTFLVFTAVSFVVVVGGYKPAIPVPIQPSVPAEVTDVTPEVLMGSVFERPFLMAVLRTNGSFSFAKIENGEISNEKFQNEVELTYQNGDSGLITEVNGNVDIFISKKGAKETAKLVERGVTSVTLPDNTFLPVKIVSGKIVRGKLAGDFELQTLTTNKKILGTFDTRGKLTSARVENVLKEPDAMTTLIGKEILKLSVSMEGKSDSRVLAATTDDVAPTAVGIPLDLGRIASFFQVKQDLGDGSLTIVSQPSPGFPATGITTAGLAGAVGPAGPTGAKGDKGDKGDQGIAGALGPAGADGATGPAGADGTTGTAGVSSLNLLTGALNIAGGGINSITTNGTDTITVTGTLPSLDPTYFTTANISQWTNNSGYITSSGTATNFSGSLSGDVSGTQGATSVDKINGVTLGLTTATAGNLLIGSGTQWVTQGLSGDATVASTGVITLKNTGAANTYGSALNIPVFTTDAQGRVTAVTNTAISGLTTSNLSATAGILNTQLANSSITVTPTAGTGISVSGSPVSLGGTLTIAGIDATTAVKGVASYNSTNFTVTLGTVDTIQGISSAASPTFTGLTLSGLTASSGVYTNGSSALTSTPPTSGVLGYWSRTGTTLSPSNAGDAVTTSGNISTTGGGTITSNGLSTATNGLTLSAGALNMTSTSGALSITGLGSSTISTTSNGLTLSTVTSGTLTLTSAGALNMSAGAASTFTLANVANALNFDSNTLSIDALNNRLGIGTNAPSYGLSVVGTQASGNIASISNFDTSSSATKSVIRINIGTPTGTNLTRFMQFYAGVTTEAGAGTGVGAIRLNNAGVTYVSGSADLAEVLDVAGSPTVGDIIGVDSSGNLKATTGNLLVGVVSDNPAFLGNSASGDPGPGQAIVGYLGLVTTKVNNSNGSIAVGDPITVSSTAGVGMKATKEGPIIGRATQVFSSGTPGTITVQVNPGWYNPDPLIPASSTAFTIAGNSDIIDSFGGVVTKIGGFRGLISRDATISGTFKSNGSTTIGDASGDGLTINSGSWTLPNSTTVGLNGAVNSLNFDSNTFSIDALNNRIGMGTAAPSYGLSIVGNSSTTPIASISNFNTTDVSTNSVMRFTTGTAVGSATGTRFIQFLGGVTSEGGAGTGVGNIKMQNSGVQFVSGNADLAEWTEVAESVADGDIISSKSTGNTKAVVGDLLLGVVTDTAAFVGNDSNDNSGKAIVGMLGRVNTKVDTTNGNIAIGDPIAPSSVAGVGMKQTKAGPTIGKALATKTTSGVERIAVQVIPGWYDPDALLTTPAVFTVTGSGDILDQYDDVVTRIGGFEGLFVRDASISGTFSLHTENFTDLTGDGLNNLSGALGINLNLGSGLEVSGSGLSLLRTCSDTQVLKWDAGSSAWVCSSSTAASAALDSLTPATGAHSISNGNNAQTWNWSLSSTNNGMNFSENIASTGTGYIVSVGTLATSTAKPFRIIAQGSTIFDTTNTGGITIGNTTVNTPITIQSGTGAINIGVSTAKTITLGNTTGATAVNINSGTGNVNFTVGPTSSSGRVQIGNSASATPDLLVLDNGTADPTGVLGGMYYNTSTGTYRCYSDSAWRNCGNNQTRSFVDTTSDAVVDANTTSYWDIATENNSSFPNITLSSTSKSVYGIVTMETTSSGNGDVEITARAEANIGSVAACNSGTAVGGSPGTFSSNTGGQKTSTSSFIYSPGSTSAIFFNICSDVATVNTTGNVTRLRVTLFEVDNSNADLAEVYPTNDNTLVAGEVVSLDTEMRYGVKRSLGAYDSNVLGIISTEPALMIGGKGDEGVTGVAVALSGRVPVRVSNENGEIKAGDLLTSSSIPGVAMKATKAGTVIGTAMNGFIGDTVGTVLAFVKSGQSNGGKLAEVMSGVDVSNGGNVLASLIENKNQISTASANVSEILSDRIVAGVEIITPKVITQDILATGMFVMQDKDGNENVRISSDGNAIFMGTIKADKIEANEIKGFKLLTDSISTLSDKVAGLATSSATPTASQSGGQAENKTLSMADIVNNLFRNVAEFFDKVIFHSDVFFAGRPTFNKDTAGFAIIKSGANEVEVKFEREYTNEPVVNISLNIAGDINIADIGSYAIANVNTKGFKIRLSQVTGMDLRFSWMALAVKDARSSQSQGTVDLQGSSSQGTPEVTPESTPTVTPTVEVTPTPTSTMEITPTPTVSVTPTPEVTPIITPEASTSAQL